MSPFGYGIIGCGWVASAHAWGIKALASEGVALVAVADTDVSRAASLGMTFGAPHVLDDYREVLARDDIGAVSICLPDFLHREVTLAAAAAGKHVLCEKPLAMDVAEADEMLQACDAAGVGLGVIMNHRYSLDNIRAKRTISQGALGRLLIGSAIHSSSLTGDPSGRSPWRGQRSLAAGGILTTQAIHFLDLLLWFMGPVTAVKAWTARLAQTSRDYEDTAVLALRLASGALATLTTTNGAPIEDDFTGTRIEVQGTSGYLMLEGDHLRLTMTSEGGTLPPLVLPAPPEGSEEVVFGTGHVYEVVDFVRAIRSGGSVPISGADGRHLMAVLSAAYRSAADGEVVAVEEGPPAYSAVAPEASLLRGDLPGQGTGGVDGAAPEVP